MFALINPASPWRRLTLGNSRGVYEFVLKINNFWKKNIITKRRKQKLTLEEEISLKRKQ